LSLRSSRSGMPSISLPRTTSRRSMKRINVLLLKTFLLQNNSWNQNSWRRRLRRLPKNLLKNPKDPLRFQWQKCSHSLLPQSPNLTRTSTATPKGKTTAKLLNHHPPSWLLARLRKYLREEVKSILIFTSSDTTSFVLYTLDGLRNKSRALLSFNGKRRRPTTKRLEEL
jgi:hypothetical protein